MRRHCLSKELGASVGELETEIEREQVAFGGSCHAPHDHLEVVWVGERRIALCDGISEAMSNTLNARPRNVSYAQTLCVS